MAQSYNITKRVRLDYSPQFSFFAIDASNASKKVYNETVGASLYAGDFHKGVVVELPPKPKSKSKENGYAYGF